MHQQASVRCLWWEWMVRIRFFSNSLWNNGLVKRLLLLVFMNPLSLKNSRTHHNAILVPAIKNTKMIFGRESLLKMCKNTSRKCQDFPRNVLFPKFLFSPFFFFFFHYNLLFYNYLPGILSKLQARQFEIMIYPDTAHLFDFSVLLPEIHLYATSDVKSK